MFLCNFNYWHMLLNDFKMFAWTKQQSASVNLELVHQICLVSCGAFIFYCFGCCITFPYSCPLPLHRLSYFSSLQLKGGSSGFKLGCSAVVSLLSKQTSVRIHSQGENFTFYPKVRPFSSHRHLKVWVLAWVESYLKSVILKDSSNY